MITNGFNVYAKQTNLIRGLLVHAILFQYFLRN